MSGRRFGASSKAAVWLATAGGVGFGPWAPGTWGALEGVLLFFLFWPLGGGVYLLLVIVLGGLGVWAAGAAEKHFGRHDDGRIVIDEVVGQLLALFPLVALRDIPLLCSTIGAGGALAGHPASDASPVANPVASAFGGLDLRWPLVALAFVAFRFFDIRKPGLVRVAEERIAGGAGVMADDVVAGLFAAAVVTLPAYAAVVDRLHALITQPALLETLRAAGWLRGLA